MSPTVFTLAMPTPLRRPFHYLPDDPTAPPPLPGARILAPFGRRNLVGVYLCSTCLAEDEQHLLPKLKQIGRRLDTDEPAFAAAELRLARFAARYYQHPLGDVLHQCLPTALRDGRPLQDRQETLQLVDTAATVPARAHRQRALVAWLREHGDIQPTTAVIAAGFSRGLIRELLRLGIAAITFRQVDTLPPFAIADDPADVGLALNEEQAAAVQALATSGCGTFLLHGITGSGKTEVYMQAIDRVLRQGRQALVLVPEIGLTPQTRRRFEVRFHERLGVAVTCLHSGLSDGERLAGWRAARAGHAGVVIGTRSAIFTPFRDLGIIVVDEEHDVSYRQQDGFRYSARDLAVVRGRDLSVPVVLGSATPALESLENARAGRYTLLRLSRRASGAAHPHMRPIDLRGQRTADGLSDALRDLIRQHLDAGGQVLAYLNRRGFAPVLLCHDCGWAADCPHCDARLTLHLGARRLVCHHCGFNRAPPRTCPECGGTDMQAIGLGTERTEQALQTAFPAVPVHRIDRDTVRGNARLETLLAEVAAGGPCILIGTQMIAKGHHFPAVTLAAVIDADGALYSSDFRATERFAQTLIQVAGRAGRADRAGEMVVQTHQPQHPHLANLLQAGYDGLVDELLRERRLAGFPPFGHMALLRAEAAEADAALQWLEQARDGALALRAAAPDSGPDPGIEVIGPAPAPMARRSGRHRCQLMLLSRARPPLQKLLAAWVASLEGSAPKAVRWAIDVDPPETL